MKKKKKNIDTACKSVSHIQASLLLTCPESCWVRSSNEKKDDGNKQNGKIDVATEIWKREKTMHVAFINSVQTSGVSPNQTPSNNNIQTILHHS